MATPGVTNNPNGRPASVWQSYADRSAHYAALPASELLALADDENLEKKKSTFDCMIIQNLANTIRRGKKNKKGDIVTTDPQFAATERERFFDRYIGKPKEIETTDDPLKALSTDEIRDLLAYAAGRLAEARAARNADAALTLDAKAGRLPPIPKTNRVP